MSAPAPPRRTARFILYSRSYCHLCQDMLDALMALQSAELRFAVEVIDVDADADLLERFDELVPVLFAADAAADAGPQEGAQGRELCHYFLDEAAVRAHLERCTAEPLRRA